MTSSFKKFTGPLDYRYDAEASRSLGGDHWRVLKGFRYYVGELGSDEWVDVCCGELTDRATVPRLLHSLLPPDGIHGQAAVVHDKLCRTLQISRGGDLISISRSRADEIFLEAMEALEVSWLRRRAAYAAVCAYRYVTFTRAPQEDARKVALESLWRQLYGMDC